MGALTPGSPTPPPSPPPIASLHARARRHRLASWARSHVHSMSYFVRWLTLGAVIGVVAGFGAVAFYEALRLSTQFFLQVLAGYRVPTPAGEGNALGSAGYLRPWSIPLVVVAGGLGAGFLIFTWAPEAEGHGTDAAIDAVHHNPRGIRLRAVVIKIVASALTIGSGGSGGREGPTAQISAGFGSLLARVLDLSPEDGRIAVSVGIGSGIGAIFSAPLGGAVLAAEVVYRDDFEYEALLPGLFASIVAYAIFGAVYGYHPLFATPTYRFDQPIQLLWFGLIGVLAGGIGLVYSKSFYGVVGLSGRLPISRKLRPALGALLVGLLALGLPEVLGTGYGWVQESLSNELAHTPLWIILLLPFARIAATASSIGSGGSGGVFGPGMVIGAFTGLAFWRLFEPFAPGVGHTPAPYVVVGMMAVFGGISRAPLAVMLMVAEMTGNISVLGPAMVAVAIATFIVNRTDDSIYRSQLRRKAESPASRLQFAMPLLATLNVDSISKPPRVILHEGDLADEAAEALRAAGVPGAPVVDSHGYYRGAVETDELEARLAKVPDLTVDQAVDPTAMTVSISEKANAALEALTLASGNWVTVTGDHRRVVGVLAVSDVVRGYRLALTKSFGQISLITPESVIVERRVGRDSPLIDVPLRQAALPAGCIIFSAQRGEEMIFATGATVLRSGDAVIALTQAGNKDEVATLIRGEEATQAANTESQGVPLM